ncbi:LuxR C-terminal-related transcriptional regulator [Stenotrophomonas maltophilia]|uniref:LuxR C-terminal-related transcriptional regulator n=1 Tax=Stenotrophomonas maltophilia TaxID=40324 RepID=UPI0039F6E7EF
MNEPPPPRRLRLALLDDHDVVRRGVALHLGSDPRFQISFSHGRSRPFLQYLQAQPVDVAIIDITLAPGDLRGAELVHALQDRAPRVVLLAFAAQSSKAGIHLLLDAGISGYVGKSEPLPALSEAVLRVAQGLCRLPEGCSLPPAREPLSRNEREVLQLLLEGLTVSEIAQCRHRSIKTVSTQKVSALRKLGLRNDAEIYALRTQMEAL